jgi:diacylglycerol kinase
MSWLKKRIYSFRYAFEGIYDLFAHHPNAQVHLFASITVLTAAFIFPLSKIEWCLVIICVGIVVAAEAFNTAIEYLVDWISPDIHPAAKKIKDMGAAGVLLTSFSAVGVGLFIFLPKIIAFLGH